MTKEEAATILEKHFNFFLDELDFKLTSIEIDKYYLNAKLLSNRVGLFFCYEFRDFVPRIQFSLLTTPDIIQRPGLWTLIENYKNSKFFVQDFYLDEILSYNNLIYLDYFKSAKTFEECLNIINDLSKQYANALALGDLVSYSALNEWLKTKVSNQSLG